MLEAWSRGAHCERGGGVPTLLLSRDASANHTGSMAPWHHGTLRSHVSVHCGLTYRTCFCDEVKVLMLVPSTTLSPQMPEAPFLPVLIVSAFIQKRLTFDL